LEYINMEKTSFRIIFGLIAAILFSGAAYAEPQVPASVQQMQLSFAPLVKKTGPAVVNIYTKRVVQEQMRSISPFFNDPFSTSFSMGRSSAARCGKGSRIPWVPA